jgi:hypothetical protein
LLDAWLARYGARLTTLLTGHIQGTLDDLRQQFGSTT